MILDKIRSFTRHYFLATLFMIAISMNASAQMLDADTTGLYKNPHYSYQNTFHSMYQTNYAKIVMLGNSITDGVNWSELLNRSYVIERGIPSDIVRGFYARLDNILALEPEYYFIMGGINDIYSGVPMDEMLIYYRKIIDTLLENDIVPVIQSTLYVNPKWHSAKKNNKIVTQLNDQLRELAEDEGIEFLDINTILSEDNVLKTEVTSDGVHLNATGYQLWGEFLDAYLSGIGYDSNR